MINSVMIVDLITFLIFWLLVLSGDFIIFTVMFRLVVKKWWWQKDIKKPWEFTISSDGWSFSAQDFNPIETFRKMLNHITGADKSTEELVKQILNDKLKEYLKNKAKAELNKDLADRIFDKVLNEFIKQYLSDIDGKDNGKHNNR